VLADEKEIRIKIHAKQYYNISRLLFLDEPSLLRLLAFSSLFWVKLCQVVVAVV
jgi:hypothetical protein